MPNTQPKQKATRNKTIDCTLEEGKSLLSHCARAEKPTTFTEIENRVIIGDSFSVMPLLPQGFVDLLIVDPPYNLSKEFHGERFAKRTGEDYRAYTEQWVSLAKPLLKPGASVYVCCDWRSSGIVGEVLEKHFLIQNRITWQREKGRGAKQNWKNSVEDIWFATCSKDYTFHLDAVMMRKRVIAPYRVEGKPKDWEETGEGNFRNTCPSNFWDDISVPYWSMPENTAHPTQKPEKLIAKLILASSSAGDVVFDPFAGSGTTAVTAQKLGRRFVTIEQNELYCVWAQKRLAMALENPTIQGYRNGVFWERNTAALQKIAEPKEEHQVLDLEERVAYDTALIDRLVAAVAAQDGIDDKAKLAQLLSAQFSLEQKGKIFFCPQFSIRFCKSKGGSISNTVLALSKLLQFDDKPFFVCAVAPDHNRLMLANTTCLSKISHSSRDLREDHIRGNFNWSDILREVGGFPNAPESFSKIFALHQRTPQEENIFRLVAATQAIAGIKKPFVSDEEQKKNILGAIARSDDFVSSAHFSALKRELDRRVEVVREEISLAARVDNVNVRGRIIETLIASDDMALKEKISQSLRNGTPTPQFRTADELGDYTVCLGGLSVAVDIKSKSLSKQSNPKGYNVDKLLEFLSQPNAVYLIYLVGFDEQGSVLTQLCPILGDGMLDATGSVQHHWAGRNSRGVIQFDGHALSKLFSEPNAQITMERATAFLTMLLDIGE